MIKLSPPLFECAKAMGKESVSVAEVRDSLGITYSNTYQRLMSLIFACAVERVDMYKYKVIAEYTTNIPDCPQISKQIESVLIAVKNGNQYNRDIQDAGKVNQKSVTHYLQVLMDHNLIERVSGCDAKISGRRGYAYIATGKEYNIGRTVLAKQARKAKVAYNESIEEINDEWYQTARALPAIGERRHGQPLWA